MPKLVIADDHSLILGGIVAHLQGMEDMEICATVSSGYEAIQACQAQQPDLLLLDIQLPDLSGIETAQRLKALLPGLKIIAITGSEDTLEILKMMQAGAAACLHKGSPLALEEMIPLVMAGYSLMPEFVLAALLQNTYLPTENLADAGPNFTPQEYVVLRELMQGYTNKEMALRLNLSTSTVKVHLSSIFRKLNVQTRTEAVAFIKLHKLLNP
jgi:DNA-binding NarL/FixJ family response regulator